VQAALDLPWTTGPTEGQINRLKMLKRTMYGRASFQLLRQRSYMPLNPRNDSTHIAGDPLVSRHSHSVDSARCARLSAANS
jgi:hypothetical protein